METLSLSRAEVPSLELSHSGGVSSAPMMSKSDLDPYQIKKLDDLLAEYSCIFAENLCHFLKNGWMKSLIPEVWRTAMLTPVSVSHIPV